MAIKEFDGQLDEEIQEPLIKEFTGKLDGELPAQPKEATVGGELLAGGERYASSYKTAVDAFTGDPVAATRAGEARQKDIVQRYGQARGLDETRKAYEERGVLGAGAEVASQVPTALSGQGANLAVMGAGALAGAPGGPITSALGAIATQVVPFFEQNLIAQLRAQEERGEPVDLNRAKAAAYAALQASAEVGGTVLAFGGKLLGRIIGTKPAAEATEALVKAAKESLLVASGKGATRATGAEIPVEIAQNILQRHQAGESLTDDDALEDYKNTIYGTILVAGPLGAGAGPVNRMQARSELDRRELAKTQTEETDRELADAGKEQTQEQTEQEVADIEKKLADINATPIDFEDVDGTDSAQKQAATPADQSYAPGTIMPDGTIIASQGDQNAAGQPVAGGVGVGATVSGQPGGVPAAGVGGVDGTGVAVVGDTSAQTQAGTAGQPSALTPAAPIAPSSFNYEVTNTPAYEGIDPLTPEDADFELEALENRATKGRLTPEVFAQSEIGKRLGTSTIMGINEGLRNDPLGTIQALRQQVQQKASAAATTPAATTPAATTPATTTPATTTPATTTPAATTPAATTPAAVSFDNWLNQKGIPLTSITSQEQWDALQQQWNQETGGGSQQAAPAVTTSATTTPETQNLGMDALGSMLGGTGVKSSAENNETETAKLDAKERRAFGTNLGAVTETTFLRGSDNVTLSRALLAGDASKVLSILAKSKNKIVSRLAEQAKKITGLKFTTAENVSEEYKINGGFNKDLETAKTNLALLGLFRAAKAEVDAAPGDTLPSLSSYRTTVETMRQNGEPYTAPLYLDTVVSGKDKKSFYQTLETLENGVGRQEDLIRAYTNFANTRTAISAVYDAQTKTITAQVTKGYNGQIFGVRETDIAHEITHALSVEAIANPTPAQKPVIRRLRTLFDAVKNDPLLNNTYGVTAFEEFVAEGNTNPDFQFRLSKIKYQNTSAMSKFAEYIAQLLGLKADNAFTEFLTSFDDLANATTPGAKKETAAQRNVARQEAKQAEAAAPEGKKKATKPAPIKTKTDTGLDVEAEKKVGLPIHYVDGYTPTPEPSASNFLNQTTLYNDAAPLTVENGIYTAAAYQAFDMYDSAHGSVQNVLRREAGKKNKELKPKKKFSSARPLEFTTLSDIINLYKQYAGTRKTFETGGASRILAAKNRAAFIKSLTPEQRTQYEKALAEVLKRQVAAEGAGRRATTEADLRKQKEEDENKAKKQKKKAVADVQEQVAEANKTPEQIEAEERADAEAFAKQQEADKDKSDTADALKSEAQVEKEAKTEAVKEVKEAKEKKVSTRDKRIQSAIKDSGDIKSILNEVAGGEVTPVSLMAKKLADIFKYLGIADPTAKRISFGKVPDGNDGMYDPTKNRIYIQGENGQYTGGRDLGEVVMHEITHYYIDHVIDNKQKYLASLPAEERPAVKAALNRLNQNFKLAKEKLGDQFNIPTIKEFIAEALSNPRFQQALLNLDKSGTGYKPATKDSMFIQFVKNIMSALGVNISEKGALFGQTLEDVAQILSVPGNGLYGRSTSYSATPASKPTNMGPSKPESLFDDSLVEGENGKYSVESFKPKSLLSRLAKTVMPSSLVTKFQNTKHAIKTLENQADLSDLIEYDGPNQNNFYTEATLSAERGSMNYRREALPHIADLETALNKLVKLTNSTTEKTVGKLGMLSIALHEGERRIVKFMKSAPLRPQMADVRNQIFDLLESKTKLTKAQTDTLRNKLNAIMFEVDQNGKVKIGADGQPVVNKKNVTPLGFSPNGSTSLDVGSKTYNVVDMDGASVKNLINEYNSHPQKAAIDEALSAVRRIEAATQRLNSVSNYWSNPVSNIVAFYGWDNYVPMKARFEKDAFFDPSHRGRELQDAQSSFEGSDNTPDNPILQVMSDAARAASRSGRGNYTLTIKNAVQQGLIDGKVAAEPIQFKDRDSALPASKKKNTIFHYNKDGTVDVIEIAKPEMLEALRRTYKDGNPLVDSMNMVTGFIGKMHTRWNYAFAPMNFIRDALTNSFVLGAEFGPADSARMIAKIASQVGARGGLFKAMKVANMYENGDTKGMEAYAKKDAFVRDMVEYLNRGGAVSYTAGLSLKDKLQELNRELGRGKIIKTHEQFEKFVDVWNNMFEFSSRAAAYGIVKQRFMKQDKTRTEAQASDKAVAYVKNLANFEQVGEHGKLMGALFMFFRPAATGAVRAIESVVPAFRSVKSAVKALPSSIKNNDAARAKFEKAYAEKQKNARIMIAALGGLGVFAYTMAATMAPEDDLGRNSVHADNMKTWNRYARFHIPNEISEALGMGKNVVFQLPWGFGLGAFMASGAQIMSAISGKGTAEEALKNIFTDIALDSFIPLPVSKMEFSENPVNFMIDSLTPSIARPLLQFALNKDGLGRGIYNEPYRRMADAFSAGDRVPEAYKDAARYFFNEVGVDANPNSMYFLANSYFDGVSRLLETSYGALGLSGEKPRNIKQESLIFGSFFGNKGNVDNREFAQIQSQLMKKQANLNAVKNDPTAYVKYLERNPMDEVLVGMYLKDINGDLKKLQTEAKSIRMMPTEMISPKERQEMLEPNLLMQRLIKANLIEKYRSFDIKP